MHRLRHPLRAIREPFGTAGLIVACVALIAALGGTALAAKGALTGKQKKEVEKIAKKFAGKPGAPGAQGPAGPQGAPGPKGDKGDAGQNGTDGTNGTNGTDGEDGMCTAGNPACSLPSESTLVGAWGTSGGGGGTGIEAEHADLSLVPISFGVRVTPAPIALWDFEPSPGIAVAVRLKDGESEIYAPSGVNPEHSWEVFCPGTVDAPEAEPGYLCIYTREEHEVNNPYALGSSLQLKSRVEDANEYGIVVPWGVAERGYAKGSWAVTAE